MVTTISPQNLQSLGEDVFILDVRTLAEHQAECLACSHQHVPLDQLDAADFIARHGLNQETTVYLLCLGGVRAQKAAEKFLQAGHQNVCVIENGLNGCKVCGLSLVQAERPPMSLERQVRISAGVLVAVGAALGLWLNPWFGLLPLVVGCGLVFAGLSDSCAMGLLLAKAPWNQKECKPCQGEQA